MAELRIPLIAEFKGKKAFKDADNSIKNLSGNFKKLAGMAGIGLSAAAIVNFGKKAAKAFMEDERAAAQLAQSVKNLGLAFDTPAIENFISQMSQASGVTDDQLRPAMQRLLQTTGSVKKSTELLTQALDVSRGSGIDYETVVNDLSMAYVGNTKGLKKYALGLTNAQLKTMKFSDVQEKLTKQFSGANAAYLETYAGKMQILSTAAGEAQETIGKGLMDALSILGGEGNTIQPIADSMADLAQGTADVIVGLADVASGLKNLGGLASTKLPSGSTLGELFSPNLNMIPLLGPYLETFRLRGKAINTPGMGGYPSSALGPGYIDPNEAARKKAEADALKRAKALAALQAKSLADQKKKTALEKAAKTLELERINITAALRGKISETDRLSLQLQLAILDKNESVATKLAADLDQAVKRNNELQAALLATPKAPNPYADWSVPKLDFGGNLLGSQVPNFVPPSWSMPSDSFAQYGPLGGLGAGVVAGVNPNINITVELDGQTVGGAIKDTQINDSLSGSFNQVNRGGGFKGAVAI